MKRRRVDSKWYAQRLSDALEKERFHIASEIHDDLGGFLSLIANDLTDACRHASLLPHRERAALERATANVDSIIQRIRDRVWMLSMPMIDQITLAQALQELCSTLNSHAIGQYHFAQSGVPLQLSLQQKVQLFRMVQEILMNIIKHASANHVSVHLHGDNQRLMLVVEDDGIGRTPTTKTIRGVGQLIIHHRLRLIGATLKQTSLATGTRRTIELRRDGNGV